MNQQDQKIIQKLEALLRQRLDLFKQYPVISVEVMQNLESGNIVEANCKLDERSSLASFIDELSQNILELSSQLIDEQGIVADLLRLDTQIADYPVWASELAGCMDQTRKLLQNCSLFDAKIMSRAISVQQEIRSHLSNMRTQRKIQKSYAGRNEAAHGSHVRLSSK